MNGGEVTTKSIGSMFLKWTSLRSLLMIWGFWGGIFFFFRCLYKSATASLFFLSSLLKSSKILNVLPFLSFFPHPFRFCRFTNIWIGVWSRSLLLLKMRLERNYIISHYSCIVEYTSWSFPISLELPPHTSNLYSWNLE